MKLDLGVIERIEVRPITSGGCDAWGCCPQREVVFVVNKDVSLRVVVRGCLDEDILIREVA